MTQEYLGTAACSPDCLSHLCPRLVAHRYLGCMKGHRDLLCPQATLQRNTATLETASHAHVAARCFRDLT